MPGKTVRVRVKGRFACFTRPEGKVERFSYEVPTPSAARGVLDAICWKPQMRWIIRSIEVLNPIRFISLKRNEVIHKAPCKGKTGVVTAMRNHAGFAYPACGAGADNFTQRGTVALRDVDYVIEAEPVVFDPKENAQKFVEMLERRVRKGQCHVQPCFGCREFPAFFEPPDGTERPEEKESRNLGVMLYDIVFDRTYKDNRPVFFEARLDNGRLDTRPEMVLPDEATRKEVTACWFKR
jgi:CRISPR-associated protein Cas5d